MIAELQINRCYETVHAPSIFKAKISAFVAILKTTVSLLQENLQHHCVRCNFEKTAVPLIQNNLQVLPASERLSSLSGFSGEAQGHTRLKVLLDPRQPMAAPLVHFLGTLFLMHHRSTHLENTRNSSPKKKQEKHPQISSRTLCTLGAQNSNKTSRQKCARERERERETHTHTNTHTETSGDVCVR
jgi:hypothetical protein